MIKIMFVCVGNSCRSQMAEGFTRFLGADKVEAYSAGMEPAGVNPRAVAVMAEAGIDISGHSSKRLDLELMQQMDIIITLCGEAEEACPVTPAGVRREHWPLPDPARATGSEQKIMTQFRQVREEIRRRIEELLARLDR